MAGLLLCSIGNRHGSGVMCPCILRHFVADSESDGGFSIRRATPAHHPNDPPSFFQKGIARRCVGKGRTNTGFPLSSAAPTAKPEIMRTFHVKMTCAILRTVVPKDLHLKMAMF